MAEKKKKKIPVGRPRKIDSPEALAQVISEYIDYSNAKEKPLLISGFCLYAGICDETLRRYEAKKEFSGHIKALRRAILNYAESCLFKGSGQVAGPIFYLKNRFHDLYKDDGLRLTDGKGAPLKITVNFVDVKK